MSQQLARRLGVFDATMIVMGGIIGAGIFVNPHVVAQRVHTPLLILGVWIAGGLVALAGAFVYAELASLIPGAGGQYLYLREAYHPSLAFLYGWTLLLVIQSGGMAAVAVTFARYVNELAQITISETLVAAIALAILVVINVLGVRAGTTTQNVLMILKIAAIGTLVGLGSRASGLGVPMGDPAPDTRDPRPILAIAAAMTPVMFAYGGWQTASFVSGEMREPRRDLPRGLIFGVLGVIAIYVSVNLVCLHVLGADGLAQSKAPASAVMRAAVGEWGATFIAVGIAISTLGFLSQSMLTAPRVYFAMAEDRLFFKSVARVHPVTRVPVVAIVLQGVVAIVIAFSGTYDRILSYVVAADFIWFGLTGLAVFVFRHKGMSGYRTPGHPFTTAFFTIACWIVVIGTIAKYPVDSLIGLAIIAAGVPVYWAWSRRSLESGV